MDCGLRTLNNEPVPLKSISVEVDVLGHVASVSSCLQYENQESSAVEAVFIFPMDSNAAVYRFLARVGSTEIEAQVREKQQAREEYDDALSSGQQAFLLEESEESEDVFRLSVGSLPPGEKASVTLCYVTELAVQADEALRFCLPAVLNPRYTPTGCESITTEVPRALKGDVPYTLSLEVHVYSPSQIMSIESNCPLTPLEILSQDKTEAKVMLLPGHKFDTDVELLLYYVQPHLPTAILEAGQSSAKSGDLMGDTVALLSFYPENKAVTSSSNASSNEFIFLMDCSGSMAGGRIVTAKETLLLLLKSLPIGCLFNVYSFGSTHTSFFPKRVEYTQQTMESALKKVKSMDANLGGTEILRPLQEIYSAACLPTHPRQLFVFTDGEVGNTKNVIDLVKMNALSHRCFTFGIGEGASSALVNGMAEQGSGHAQFITGTDRLQAKVMQSLKFSMQPVVRDISVQWDVPPGVTVSPFSPPPTVLFQGQRLLVYAQFTNESHSSMEGSVTLCYNFGNESVKNKLTFNRKPEEDSRFLLHRLGARAAIKTLEGEVREGRHGNITEKVVELSTQSGVSSSHTAFIAVHAGNKEPIKGPLLHRRIPICGSRHITLGAVDAIEYCSFQKLRSAKSSGSKKSYKVARHGTPEAEDAGQYCSVQTRNAKSSESKRFYEGKLSRLLGGSKLKPRSFKGTQGTRHTTPEAEDAEQYCSVQTRNAKSSESKRSYEGKLSRLLGGPKLKPRSFKGTQVKPCSVDSSSEYHFESCERSGQPEAIDDTFNSLDHKKSDDWPRNLVRIINMQNADGSWDFSQSLLSILKTNEEEVAKASPEQSGLSSVWASVLAVLWLHGHMARFKDEWQLIAQKAVCWIKTQTEADPSTLVSSGNSLLGLQVELKALEL